MITETKFKTLAPFYDSLSSILGVNSIRKKVIKLSKPKNKIIAFIGNIFIQIFEGETYREFLKQVLETNSLRIKK